MKTNRQIFLAIVCLLTTSIFYAQNDFKAKIKGSYFANGSILIHNTTHKVNDNKSSSFSMAITPKAGYFIIDNLAAGVELTLLSSKEESDDLFGEATTKTTGFAFSPFARYYFENGFFGEALIGIGSQNTNIESEFLDSESKASIFGFRVGAGYSYHIGNHIAIEPSVNYSSENINPKDAPSNYKENLSSLFLGIGLSAYF